MKNPKAIPRGGQVIDAMPGRDRDILPFGVDRHRIGDREFAQRIVQQNRFGRVEDGRVEEDGVGTRASICREDRFSQRYAVGTWTGNQCCNIILYIPIHNVSVVKNSHC